MLTPYLWLIVTVPVLSLLLFVWIRYVRSCYQVFAKLGIPGPRPSFLFGNAAAFANKFPMDVFKEWANTFGPVFGFYEGLNPSVVVCCPDLAYKILVKHFKQFSNRPVINPFTHDHQDLSLQNVSGPLWKRQRQAVSAGMSSKSIREMFPLIYDVTNNLIQWLDKAASGNPSGFYIDDAIERYSLDWFSQAALGYHSDALTNDKNLFLRYMRASHESMSPHNVVTGVAKLFPWTTAVLKPLDRQHRTLSSLQTREVTEFVRALKTDLAKLTASSCHGVIFNLITKRVSAVCHEAEMSGEAVDHPRKSQLEEKEVVGEVSGLLGGGVGPFSSTLTFCLYCLAAYPCEQERLRTELANVTNTKDALDMDQLSSLPLMDRFIKETLRCYPVAPGVSRVCVDDCVLDGVQFKRGMVVRVMFSCMYNQEKHFPNPQSFSPDRFQAEDNHDDSSDVSHRATPFMPFGLGPRMCVGRRLAEMVLKLALTRILQNFQILRSDVTQVPLPVTLRPFLVARDGVHIRMKQIRQ
ncbi:hypothetical protein BsWGS_18579 [Bradybaena similaris]